MAELQNLTGIAEEDPAFWVWIEGKANDRKFLGLWRDTAGIHLRQRGDLMRLEELKAYWDGKWDEQTRVNYLAEMRHAQWMAGREDLLGEAAGTWLAELPDSLLQRWQDGARGYAFVRFRDYARKRPGDGRMLNNLAWLLATAVPDGLEHAGMGQWAEQALEWAERAMAMSGGSMPEVWNTLAAARANAGEYEGAVAAAGRGLELARRNGNQSLAEGIRQCLAAYSDGRPWRE